MPLYPFGPNDIFYNRVKTHPKVDFFLYDTKIYYNNIGVDLGSFHSQSLHIPPGYVSLHELNVDRNASASKALIYPFITKESGISAFKTVSTTNFNSGYLYGEEIEGSYPLSASLSFDLYKTSSRARLDALQNTLNHYKYLSPHYEYVGTLGSKKTDPVRLVSIPSIFYGSTIKKGSVSLKFYISGTLVGELQDPHKNGELIQVSGTANALGADYGSGSVAGVVLYDEGFMILTGSWPLDPGHVGRYTSSADDGYPQWLAVGQTLDGTQGNVTALHNASWGLSFEGTNYVPTLTMLANAPRGLFNHSNNPTYITHGQPTSTYIPSTSSATYVEQDNIKIKNTVSSSWAMVESSNQTDVLESSGSFKKQVYISKVGIYDSKKNLIAIAKLAKPIKKTESDDLTIKMKLDF